MKKSLIVAVCVLLIGLGSVCYMIPGIEAGKEDVTVREQTLEGDKQAAEGIIFQVNVQEGGHLLWNTVYRIGERDTCDTRFTFSQRANEDIRFLDATENLKKEPLTLYGDYAAVERLKEIWSERQDRADREGNEGLDAASSDPSGWSMSNLVYYFPEAVRASWEQSGFGVGTGDGTSADKTDGEKEDAGRVRVMDDYPYYPLRLRVDREKYARDVLMNAWGAGNGPEAADWFDSVWSNEDGYDVTDLLRVPVSQEVMLSASAEWSDRTSPKNVVMIIDVELENLPKFHSVQAKDERGYYVSFYFTAGEKRLTAGEINTAAAEEDHTPFSCGSEAGNGIWFIPVKKVNGQEIPFYPEVEKRYSLPEESVVMDIRVIGEEQLLLAVWEEGAWRFDTLNLRDGSRICGETLLDDPDSSYLEIRQVADRQLLMLSDGRFCLAEKEDGRFRPEISGRLDTDGGVWRWSPDVTQVYEGAEGMTQVPVYEAAYEDGRLAFVSADDLYGCSVRLHVYDRTGLRYRGYYEHSLEGQANVTGFPQAWSRGAYRIGFEPSLARP